MKNISKPKNNILEGPIASSLIYFALPIAASSFLQQLFTACDQAVVGRFTGSLGLAAVGANTTVVALLINVFGSIAIGVNALIARQIGEGNEKRINVVVHTAITFAATAGFLMLILTQFIAGPLLTLIGTPDNILSQATLYLKIYALGFPFTMVYNFGSAALRSSGDTKRPMAALISAGVLNVILNLIFVIAFRMGVAGVACATAISNIVSAAAVLLFLIRNRSYLHFDFHKLGIDFLSLRQILQIGAPAALQSAVFSVANVCIQSGINSIGSNAVAGSAAAQNIEYMSFFICNAFGQAATTFCGQNYGAGQKDRCRRTVKIALTESVTAMLIFDFSCIACRYFLISIFTSDPAVAQYAYQRMFFDIAFHSMICFYEIPGAALRSMGYPLGPSLLTIIGSVGFRVLWLLTVFAAIPDFRIIMLVYPASWLVTSTLVLSYYFYRRKNMYAGPASKASGTQVYAD